MRTRTLLMIGVLAFLATAVLWRLGDARFTLRPAPAASAQLQSNFTNLIASRVPVHAVSPGNSRLSSNAASAGATAARTPSLRLTNTDRSVDELSWDDRAVILRNAWIDTSVGKGLDIPEHLRAAEEPGSYVVQASGPIDSAFQEALRAAGARFVSYIPNNAYLVAATVLQAERLRGLPVVGAVLPYEPYFKLSTDLLERAVRNEALPAEQNLIVTLLPGSGPEALSALHFTLRAEFPTPFGPAYVVQSGGRGLAALARIPEVQGIELFRQRQLLNDRTRAQIGISIGTNVPGSYTNYLGLTGINVAVNVNDSGIDATHPELVGRVTGDSPSTLIDLNGHGTHTAGTIAGNGLMSATVTNAPGSSIPGADFRGMAPEATLYALSVDLNTGPLISDAYLQQAAATNYYLVQGRTNLLISNNSWGYVDVFDYTVASASYDAAVRDALPERSGAQPILYVFSAGNEGFGADNGQGGEPNSIRAPGTGKNVITVGAMDSLREITNGVPTVLPDGTIVTNQVFLSETDSNDEITPFSGRGNVEPGIEGRFGRFKPDVVAPGAFTISARGSDWVNPNFFTDVQVNRIERQSVSPGARNWYSLFVADRAAEFRVRLLPNANSPDPMPGLPMYLRYGDIPSVTDFIRTNNVIHVPPDDVPRPGLWYYSVGNFEGRAVSYDIQTLVVITNGNDSYFQELKKLNDGLAPYYRYESGTSMAAPAVSGLLALYQDYFQRVGRATTPALLKALLINGARSLGSHYNFSVRDVLNLQGWGGANLTNALPAGEIGSPTGGVHAVQFSEQLGTNSLSTGEIRSWRVIVSPTAADQILKFTLVWTDPPGNPNAGKKLVNDLDLVVRNVDSGEEYHGNDMPFRSDFNIAHPPGTTTITNDNVNNVENILLRPPVGTNYLVTVRGRRVNVNAVTAHPDSIAQDFVLVASVADTSLTNVLNIQLSVEPDPASLPIVRVLTNGLPIIRARTGAMPPRFGIRPGDPTQWSFFVFTNLQQNTPANVGITNGQYVAFLTFGALNLGRPRESGADIDLFATTDGSLTNLNPVAIQNALKSARRGGSETIILTNAALGDVFYIGVKAEDQQGAEFSIAGLSSNEPFDEDDENGNRIVRGIPYHVEIPDGSPDDPQNGYVFGIVSTPFLVRQVTVTNTVMFDSTGDLHLNLSHDYDFAVLSNHELVDDAPSGFKKFCYDDSGAQVDCDGEPSRPSDGPGSLEDFAGKEALGAWILSVTDNALTQVATNVVMRMTIAKEPEDDSIFFTLRAGEWVRTSRRIPVSATNVIVSVTDIDSANNLEVYLRRNFPPSRADFDKMAVIPGGMTQGFLTLGLGDVPPLNPGRYFAGVYNPGPEIATGFLKLDFEVDPNLAGDQAYGTTAPLPLPDDAVIRSTIPVLDDRAIADVRVGVRVDHPRVSDLVFHLISPQGTRLVLSENRGGEAGTAYGADRGATRIFTSFTDDTNRTVTPIKIGIAPFTNSPIASTASNRVLMADSFEATGARTYLAGESILPGWRVGSGQASVIRIPPGSANGFDGEQYLVLGSGVSSVSTNVTLSQGSLYRLRFGAGRLAGGQAQGIQVYLNGSLIYELKSDTLGVGWYQSSFLFGATARQNVLEFRTPSGAGGRTALAIDNVIVDEDDSAVNSYFLPEERLLPLIGQRSVGDWRLEIADTRDGPVGGGQTTLVDWRLELDFEAEGFNAIKLTNGIPYFGTANFDEIQYFYVDTPACATIAVNTLAGELATLLLFGDRDGLPQADLEDFLDDYGPYINVEAGGRATLTLTTNFPASAPLRPGQRYFLAVRNFQPDRPDNPFGIMVQFDCEDPPFPVVPSLTNGIPVRATIEPGPGLHYYQFNVSSNAIGADFELTPLSGSDVDLFIKRGRITPPDPIDTQPLPSPNSFDYASVLPGTAVDLISIDRLSLPEGLVPGIWFVGVRNGDVIPAEYSIVVNERYATIINLTNSVPYTNSIAPIADPFLGVQGADLQYYAFLVSSNSVQATFETFGADGNVNLFVRRGLPIPTPFDAHFSGLNQGNADEFIAVTNTTTPIWLSPGWWFLSVINADVTNVNYAIRATEVPGFITALTNNVAVTNTVGPGPTPDYYSFTVSPEALSAQFEVYDMSSGTDLLLRRGLPLPTLNDFTYQSSNAGTTNEFIELTPYSFPVGLAPGDWYLSVINSGTNNATYTIRAIESTAIVTPLTNGVPYNAAIQPGGALDYYSFLIETNALAAEFKLTSAGAGDLDLFLKKDAPLPNAANAHYVSTNAGNADELIRIEPNSTPVPLSPGLWYLSVTNSSAVPIGYEITATQFGVEPPPISGIVTNIVITDTSTCITWISIPTTNYYVVAKTNALDAAWTPVSPTITAVDTSTTFCLQPPGPWRFFDVLEGESPGVPIPAPAPVLRFDGSNICVGFASVPGTDYYIQGRKVSTDPNWVTLTPGIRATAPFTEVCYPLEWGYRFFLVGVGQLTPPDATPLPPEVVSVEATVDSLCISWPTQAGLDYLVEAKREATDPNWSVISEAIRGDGTPGRLCLDAATEFRFFRVIEGVSVPPGAPPSVPVPNFRFTADAAFQLCLVWDTLLGGEYFVEAKQRFTDPSWTVVSPILNATGIELSYCVPLSSPWRYYQVRRVNQPPNAMPRIADIEVMPNGHLLLQWTGLAGARYQVFYTDDFPATWLPAGAPVTSLTTAFEYIDTGAATGGFSGFRMYRIEMLP